MTDDVGKLVIELEYAIHNKGLAIGEAWDLLGRAADALRSANSRLLAGRDEFIVSKGLWQEFVDGLPDMPANSRLWQPIETAPDDSTRILVSDGEQFATTEFTNGRWVLSPTAWEGGDRGGLADLEFTPTRWMIPALDSHE